MANGAKAERQIMDQRVASERDEFLAEGRAILRLDDLAEIIETFKAWEARVADWLDRSFSGCGLSGEWLSIEANNLRRAYDEALKEGYKEVLRVRSGWLAKVGPSTHRQNSAIAFESSREVLVVHGRDEALKQSVARLLETLGLIPIILHECPNKGRTIIEKFVDYSAVRFAVVLLTPDDRGGLSTEPTESYRPRARQNVLFELGFVLGKLGRENVCALYREGVEIPSDYQVAFVEADAHDGWRLNVAKELKAAGLPVDFNRLNYSAG